jgi:hypothetical protein
VSYKMRKNDKRNSRSSLHGAVSSPGFRYQVSREEFLSRLMTDERHALVDARLRSFVGNETHYELHCPDELRARITEEISRSVVVGKGEAPPKSSACNAEPDDPPKWVVGYLGSVWIDLAIDGHVIRVHYMNDNDLVAQAIESGGNEA